MEIFSFFSIAFLLIIAFTYFGGRIQTEQEENLQVLLTTQCGASIGWTNITSPLVRLSIYETAIIIAYGSTRYTLHFKDISLVTKPLYLFAHAIRFHHTNTDLPKKFILHTNMANEILELLNTHHVNIEKV